MHTDQGQFLVLGTHSLADLTVFGIAEPTDYTKLWNELRENISLVKGHDLGAGQGAFAHIAGGYDAGYYGYVSFILCLVSHTNFVSSATPTRLSSPRTCT